MRDRKSDIRHRHQKKSDNQDIEQKNRPKKWTKKNQTKNVQKTGQNILQEIRQVEQKIGQTSRQVIGQKVRHWTSDIRY